MQDDLVGACRDTVAREYAALQAAAGARPPDGDRTVTTEDVWLWVSSQTTERFSDEDINGVLVAAGVEDERDVRLAAFTHVVVHMFEAFFRMLDIHGTGYITQARLFSAS
jgi:DNA/RNA-binding domain of Phe-tRNA-synthetase-like protein